VEKTRQQTRGRFPTLQVNRTFLAWRDAWVLKGSQRRKDRRAGERITLPAVEIKAA
jgi:hypothetical protein